MLAEAGMADRIMEFVSDHPWPGCTWQITEGFGITWMSGAILSMLTTAALMIALTVPVARRYRHSPAGSANFLEVLVVFIRDMIARPALHDKAYEYLSFLATLFLFILGMNLIGFLPLESVSRMMGWPALAHTPTCVPVVCGALASLAFLRIVVGGLSRQAAKRHLERHWPMWLCVVLSPVLWFFSLSPAIPGLVGKILAVPLAALEMIGTVAKCFSLVVRLCANMMSGHTLLAILMVFVFQAVGAFLQTRATGLFYIGPAAVAAAVAVSMLELLVAVLQAYIFTFLTAMFLGLYVTGSH